MKTMLLATSLVALLCAPALADQKTMQLGFKLVSGTDARTYALKLVDGACGNIEASTRDTHDKIKVCVSPEGGNDTRLEIDWETRAGDHQLRNRSTVIAARGQTFELDGGTAKLVVTYQ